MEPGRLTVGELAFPGSLRDQLVAAILAGTKTTPSGLAADYEREGEPLPLGGRLAGRARARRPGPHRR